MRRSLLGLVVLFMIVPGVAKAQGPAASVVTYEVGAVNCMQKVMQDDALLGCWGRSPHVDLARNEYEGAQLLIRSLIGDLKSVRVSVTDLADRHTRAVLSKANIDLWVVGYVDTHDLWNPSLSRGWWPDPLLLMEPVDVPQAKVQPVWIRVFAPEGTVPGAYEGTLTVAPANAPPRTLPLTVTVFDFTMPRENHFITTFPLWGDQLARFYGWSDVPLEVWKNQFDFLCRYRIGVMTVGWGWTTSGLCGSIKKVNGRYDYSAIDDILDFCITRNMVGISMGDFRAGPYTPEYEAELRRFLSDYSRHLKQKGWFDRMYIKVEDEPAADRIEAVKQQVKLIHDIDPDIRCLCALPRLVESTGELVPLMDIWVPVLDWYRPDTAEQLRKRGQDVWWYICGGPAHPYPNYFIFYPGIDQRIIPWMGWKENTNGLLYWGLNYWGGGNIEGKGGKHWPDVPWDTVASRSGDGYLLYPGKDGAVLSSVRMELVRDGLEDYEYSWLLDDLTKRLEIRNNVSDARLIADNRRLLHDDATVVRSRADYTKEPVVLYAMRRKLARQIERTGRALGRSRADARAVS